MGKSRKNVLPDSDKTGRYGRSFNKPADEVSRGGLPAKGGPSWVPEAGGPVVAGRQQGPAGGGADDRGDPDGPADAAQFGQASRWAATSSIRDSGSSPKLHAASSWGETQGLMASTPALT